MAVVLWQNQFYRIGPRSPNPMVVREMKQKYRDAPRLQSSQLAKKIEPMKR